MRKMLDDLGIERLIPENPQRIISLCPSITETLFELGLENQLVGRTKFCIHPDSKVKKIKKIGGTKKINENIIKELKPDLIICQKEENTKEIVEFLEERYPIFVTDVNNFDEGIRMIKNIGLITNKLAESELMIEEIKNSLHNINLKNGKYLYFIWKNPWMIAGKNTYIDSVLSMFGLINAVTDFTSLYPTLDNLTDIQQDTIDYLFLSSEPYPFNEQDILEIQKVFPNTKVQLVDGEIFSWYGSRMKCIHEYMKEKIFY